MYFKTVLINIYVNNLLATVDTWKCVGVLKRDGKLPQPESKSSQAAVSQNNLTRFFKLGQITHPSEVHWH